MKAIRSLVFLGVTLFLISRLTRSVFAQVYTFEAGGNNSFNSAQELKEPQNLQYIYGFLSHGEDKLDYYSFELANYTPQMRITLLVHNKESSKSFKPKLVFVDPRQKATQGELPFGFPINSGGTVYEWPGGGEKLFSDDVVNESFRQGPALFKDLPAGRYTFAVADTTGAGGRYTLLIGSKKPQEELVDKFKSLVAFLRIKFNLY